jgi:hypothetical protein
MQLLRIAAVVAALGVAGPAAAGPLEVVFDKGRVTIRATDVPLREILLEWSRLGQTRIVGLEKLSGPPMTIELVEVPEQQAMAILLRSVAGYVAAPRVAEAATLSSYDRLMILATSVAAPPPPAAQRATAFVQPPQPQPYPDPIQLANGEDGPAEAVQPPGAPVFGPPTDPAGGPPGPGVPGGQVRPQMPGETGPVPGANDEEAPPEGPLTSPRPGILPAPKPPQPRP